MRPVDSSIVPLPAQSTGTAPFARRRSRAGAFSGSMKTSIREGLPVHGSDELAFDDLSCQDLDIDSCEAFEHQDPKSKLCRTNLGIIVDRSGTGDQSLASGTRKRLCDVDTRVSLAPWTVPPRPVLTARSYHGAPGMQEKGLGILGRNQNQIGT
jgi:hypothetical protein